jgi:hypothetical protein
MKLTGIRPTHGTVVAYLALVIALSGTAYAATGGSFLLGKANKADHTTALHNTGSGPALALDADAGAPLSVGSNMTRVKNLDADLLDGISSGQFQHRAGGTCGRGSAISHIKLDGGLVCNSQVMWAHVYNDGTLGDHSAGILSSNLPVSSTQYTIHTNRNVTHCAHWATIGYDQPAKFVAGFAVTMRGLSTQNVVVFPYDAGANGITSSFNLLIVC